jgi:hypothetical protein
MNTMYDDFMRTSQLPGSPDSSTDGPDIDDAVAASPKNPPRGLPAQRRQHLRFDKVFAVRVESLLFGDLVCVARNVSSGGLFLELAEPLPLGATIRVCFPVPDGSGEVVAVGEVKNHYFINYVQAGMNRAVAGMAVRFSSFESDSHRILEDCLSRLRVLH